MCVTKTLVRAIAIFLTLGFASASDNAARNAAHDEEVKNLQGKWKVASLVIRGEKSTNDEVKAISFVFKNGVVKSELLKEFTEPGFNQGRAVAFVKPQHRQFRVEAAPFAAPTFAGADFRPAIERRHAKDQTTEQPQQQRPRFTGPQRPGSLVSDFFCWGSPRRRAG